MSDDLEYKTCLSKSPFMTRMRALQKAPSCYKCPFCKKWHQTFTQPRTYHETLRREAAKVNPDLVYFDENKQHAQRHFNLWYNAGASVVFRYTGDRYEVVIR